MIYIQLSYSNLALPALLVVMDGLLSLVLRLKLERQLAIATVRMVVQLVLVGYVLTFLFAAVSPLWTALAAFIMVLFASREIVARQKRRLTGVWKYGLGAACTLLAWTLVLIGGNVWLLRSPIVSHGDVGFGAHVVLAEIGFAALATLLIFMRRGVAPLLLACVIAQRLVTTAVTKYGPCPPGQSRGVAVVSWVLRPLAVRCRSRSAAGSSCRAGWC